MTGCATASVPAESNVPLVLSFVFTAPEPNVIAMPWIVPLLVMANEIVPLLDIAPADAALKATVGRLPV